MTQHRALPSHRSRTGAVSRLVLLLACVACMSATVSAQQVSGQDIWSAADIRNLMRDYMLANGKPAPKDKDIWPLDDRLRLAACGETPEIAPPQFAIVKLYDPLQGADTMDLYGQRRTRHRRPCPRLDRFCAAIATQTGHSPPGDDADGRIEQ